MRDFKKKHHNTYSLVGGRTEIAPRIGHHVRTTYVKIEKMLDAKSEVGGAQRMFLFL